MNFSLSKEKHLKTSLTNHSRLLLDAGLYLVGDSDEMELDWTLLLAEREVLDVVKRTRELDSSLHEDHEGILLPRVDLIPLALRVQARLSPPHHYHVVILVPAAANVFLFEAVKKQDRKPFRCGRRPLLHSYCFISWWSQSCWQHFLNTI